MMQIIILQSGSSHDKKEQMRLDIEGELARGIFSHVHAYR